MVQLVWHRDDIVHMMRAPQCSIYCDDYDDIDVLDIVISFILAHVW
jgi:hypothetical protein